MMGAPQGPGRLCNVAMAAILAGMPDVWQRVLTDHVADEYGRCRECRNAAGVAAAWPCMTRQIAEEARQVHHHGVRRPGGPSGGRHAR